MLLLVVDEPPIGSSIIRPKGWGGFMRLSGSSITPKSRSTVRESGEGERGSYGAGQDLYEGMGECARPGDGVGEDLGEGEGELEPELRPSVD